MSKRQPMFQQPEAEAVAEEEASRAALEAGANGFLNGREMARVNRPVGVGLKISPEKRHQFDRMRLLTKWSYTDIFEAALDTFEEAWKAGKVKR